MAPSQVAVAQATSATFARLLRSEKAMSGHGGRCPGPCLPGSPLCPFYRDPNGFNDWTFSTVRCWGERARGTYRLVIRDVGEPAGLPSGPRLSRLSSGPSGPQRTPHKWSHVEGLGLPWDQQGR